MEFLTFRRQLWLCAAVALCCIILSLVTHRGIFHNVAWIFYGGLFFLHPVWPRSADWRDHRALRRGIRIGGAVCVFLGLFTRFGV